MESSWDYYAFGNGFLINDVLLGVMGIFGEDSYTGLLVIVALAAFIVIVPMKALTNKLHEVIAYFIIIATVMGLLFDSTINITVRDKLKPSSVFVVEDVPMLVGIPLVATNEIGWQISEWYETHMAAALPYGFQLTGGGGFAIGSTMLQDMQSFRITDSGLNYRLGNFLRDCVVPKFYLDPSAFSAIHDSKDVWAQMASNDGLRVTKESQSSVVTCAEAYDDLSTDYFSGGDVVSDLINTGMVTSQQGSNSILSGGLGALASNGDVLTAVVSTLGGGALTGNSFLQGNILAPELRQAAKDVAVMTGSNEFIASVNLQQARKGQTAGWLTAAILFRDMAGYLFAGLNLFVIGLMPIIILGLFIPKFGTKVVIMYLKVLVWLMLWWPGLTLVNHISQGYMLNALTETGSWWNGDNAPWSMSNSPIISDYAANASMAAGFLATLVPMIMWSIISGSGQAFASVLQGASGTAEARDAATKISKSSMDQGTINYDNISGNKTDTSYSDVQGDKGKSWDNASGTLSVKNEYGGTSQSVAGIDVTPKITRQTSANEALMSSVSNSVDSTWEATTKNSSAILQSSAEKAMNSIAGGFSGATSDSYQITNSEAEATARRVNASAVVSSKATEGEAYEQALTATLSAGFNLGKSEKDAVAGAVAGDVGALDALKGAGGKMGAIGAILSALNLSVDAKGQVKGSTKDSLENTTQNGSGIDDSMTITGQSGSQSGKAYNDLAQFTKNYSAQKDLSSEERNAIEHIYNASNSARNTLSDTESAAFSETVTEAYTYLAPETNSKSSVGNNSSDSVNQGAIEARNYVGDIKDRRENMVIDRAVADADVLGKYYGGVDQTESDVKKGQATVENKQDQNVKVAAGIATDTRAGADRTSGGSDDVGSANRMNVSRLGVADGDKDMQDIRLANGGVLRPEGAANIGTKETPEATVVYGMYGKDGEKIDNVIIKENENGSKFVYGVGDAQDWEKNREELRDRQERYGGTTGMVAAQAKDAFATVASLFGAEFDRERDVGKIGTIQSSSTDGIDLEGYGQIDNKGGFVLDRVVTGGSFTARDERAIVIER